MTRFAFIIHPLEAKDAARKFPALRFLPDRMIEAIMSRKKPLVASHITGIRSKAGVEAEGWFIGLPMTPHMLVGGTPVELVYERLYQCTELARAEGAQIIGLGAFTSVAGDGGITLSQRSKIAVTTGNSYTVATAIEGALKAADQVGIVPDESVLAVVGATGSIGKTCAQVMAPHFQSSIVIGRDLDRTAKLAAELPRAQASTRIADLKEADVIVTVTSSDTDVVLPEHLKPGSVICDVARPRDVSNRVAKERPDVLVIEGGVVAVPGPVEFGIGFGFPPRTAYACMSETMILALEERYENYTLGKEVSVEQVEEISRLATKHGFELAGFRSFERAVDDELIARVRRARQTVAPVRR